MASYSADLRRRVVVAMERGESADDAARRFEVHPTTARRWRRDAAAGVVLPRKVGAKPVPTKLTPDDHRRMRREVEARPGVTLRELIDELGLAVAESTVCRAPIKMGYRYKKRRWRRGSD